MNARTILRSALTLVAALLLSVSANAQLFRAYLAPTGVDTNPCTLPAPCRLLPAALNAVASGGEIWMLDSANYNTATVTIGKSVSILAVPGAVGSVIAIGGKWSTNASTIDAEFGYGSPTGGAAVVEAPQALAVIARVETYISPTTVGEDYNGISIP